MPHAALAVSWFFHITHGFADDLDTTLRQLREEAAEAVALDDRDALAHAALGIAFMENREHSKAIAEHRRALQLNPNSAFAHYASGHALMRAEKACDAVKHFDCALRLSPRDPARWSFLTLKAAALYQLHSYAEAAQLAEEAARFVVADSVWPYVHLAASLGQLHRKDEALKALEELWRRRPGLNVAAFLSWPHGRSRSAGQTNHIVDGLRKAGLREE